MEINTLGISRIKSFTDMEFTKLKKVNLKEIGRKMKKRDLAC
jgi:hypothetical protein